MAALLYIEIVFQFKSMATTKLFRLHVPTEIVLLGAVEFLLLMFALYLGLETRFGGKSWHKEFGLFLPKAIIYAAIMQLSMVSLGVYQRQASRFRDVLMLRIAAGLLLGMLPLGSIYYFVPMYFMGRGVIAFAVGYSFILIAAVRLFFVMQIATQRNLWTRVLVLGAGEATYPIRMAVEAGELNNLNIVGYVTMPSDRLLSGTPSNGIALDEPFVDYVEKNGIDEIVLAVDDHRAGLPIKDLIECKMRGINVLSLPTFFEMRTGKIRLDVLYPSWIYLSDGFRDSLLLRIGKRTFDVVSVLLLLPIILPFMLFSIVLILFESKGKGPILYRQTRLGKDERPFQIYKFRSMVADAEQDGIARWASIKDPRITRVGAFLRKSRIDESPQLFNVLKGDMSLVGPRPERPEFVTQLADSIPYYHERHRVKPGLTGWAQINYHYGASQDAVREKLQYDLFYIKNQSIFLDMLILLRTVEIVMLGEGAR